MKRFLVFLLIILFTPTFFGCSKSNNIRELNISETDNAILTIYSDNGNSESSFLFKRYGHAFLSITNISEASFVVGNKEVLANETITIGVWPIKEHFGVWYNLDSVYIEEYNKYPERVSVSIGINNNDINKISQIINDNNKWNLFFNCSKFAVKVWNAVAEESEKFDNKLFISPSYLVKEIKKFNEYALAQEIKTSNIICFHGER